MPAPFGDVTALRMGELALFLPNNGCNSSITNAVGFLDCLDAVGWASVHSDSSCGENLTECDLDGAVNPLVHVIVLVAGIVAGTDNTWAGGAISDEIFAAISGVLEGCGGIGAGDSGEYPALWE